MKKYLLPLILLALPMFSFAQNAIAGGQKRTIMVESSVDTVKSMLDDYQKIQLPPLSDFLASATDHPSAKIYSALVEGADADLQIVKKQWLDYFRAIGNYQYGYNNSLTSFYNPDDPLVYDKNNKAEHRFSVGATINIPLGDLLNQKQKRRKSKAALDQLKYQYDITIEERKLTILQAYNTVLEHLATIKVKSESAALYNAQMQISEQDFVNGKIDIIELSLERSRRSTALSTYQQARVELHNAIILLEMLTNVRILKN